MLCDLLANVWNLLRYCIFLRVSNSHRALCLEQFSILQKHSADKKQQKLGYMPAKCVAALDKWRDIWVSLREYKHDNL